MWLSNTSVWRYRGDFIENGVRRVPPPPMSCTLLGRCHTCHLTLHGAQLSVICLQSLPPSTTKAVEKMAASGRWVKGRRGDHGFIIITSPLIWREGLVSNLVGLYLPKEQGLIRLSGETNRRITQLSWPQSRSRRNLWNQENKILICRTSIQFIQNVYCIIQ